MSQLSKNRKRFLALGILLIVILAGFVILIQPYLYVLNLSEEHLDSVRFEHSNNKKLLRKKDYYLDNLAIKIVVFFTQQLFVI